MAESNRVANRQERIGHDLQSADLVVQADFETHFGLSHLGWRVSK